MGDHRKLLAWQLARHLVVLSHPFIKRLPSSERFALADQWRRASYSVVLNIAEGAARWGAKEFRRFLDMARASLHEIETILDLAVALGYFTEQELREVAEIRSRCARTVWRLLQSMKNATS